jgi:hypothetical protein
MPKQPMDYSRTVIYKICCNDLKITDVYVGHTTNFNQRKYGHKNSCNNESQKHAYNNKVYQTIRDNGGWDNWTMIQICEYPCNSIHEAILEERRYYELLNANLNMDYPGRTHKEYEKIYREKNKTKYLEKWRKYYDKSKTKISDRNKQKYTCCCGTTLRISDKARHEKRRPHLQFIQNNPISQEVEV